MPPKQTTLRQAVAEERARLLEQLLRDIAALHQLESESQQLTDSARRMAAQPCGRYSYCAVATR
jgi:hypothetical protein